VSVQKIMQSSDFLTYVQSDNKSMGVNELVTLNSSSEEDGSQAIEE